ncbi:MAG: hypothetical protein R6V62_11480 [Candidatus Fermentibacteraceae bacterium]
MTARVFRFHGSSVMAVTLLLMAALAGASLILCKGSLVYSLDDAYIHLSVSEQIARGGYGINPGELSAPSSSVIWDFLLAPFADTPFHFAVPLLINTAALFWSVLVLRRLFGKMFSGSGPFIPGLFAVCFALVANLFGLVMTGMEHSLQIALCLSVLMGVTVLASGGPMPRSMAVAMVLGPAVRYEMLAVTFAAAFVLYLRGKRGAAFLLPAVSIVPLAVFSLFLVSRGLPPLPGSVLAKLAEGGLTGGLAGSVANRLRMYSSDTDALRFAALLIVAPVVWFARRRDRLVTLFGFSVGLGHMVLGRFGWFGRYHVYSMVILLIALAWPFRETLKRFVLSGNSLRRAFILLLPLALLMLPEIGTTLKTPLASRVIHLQHGVMRKIALAYGDRIAVNDIGWVSYGNPSHVLDLWGLANEESRKHHLERGTGWMRRMVEADGAGLVMIYGSVFREEIPEEWERVAVLETAGPIVVGFSGVDIFVTPRGDSERVRAVLRTVSEDLPEGALIRMTDRH